MVKTIQLALASMILVVGLSAQDEVKAPTEADYWTIGTVRIPERIVLEVGGILALDEKRVLVSTRRGEIWLIHDPYSENPRCQLWTDGLQEPLGLLSHNGWIYTSQRSELTRMKDTDGDGTGDIFEVVCDDWPLSGNYHEYAFGPAADRSGNLWVTLNKPFGNEPFGKVDWRGWAMRITPDGEMQPACGGLRSPAGVATSPLTGDVFYSDNQGEWCGASKLAHLEEGDFHGHPYGIDSAHLPSSLMEHPGDVPNGILMPKARKEVPHFKMPVLWFPYDKMGKSPSGFVWDMSKGAFSPYEGQIFIGDQHHAEVYRCFIEKVNGHWQGACFPFRSGFDCGITRVGWSSSGDTLFVGMSNRGWGGKGNKPWGLQYVRWNKTVPFEIHSMHATAQGFDLRFTHPVDPETLQATDFVMSSYTYRLHSSYGSNEMDTKKLNITGATLAADGQTVQLVVEGLRSGYVHELHLKDLLSAKGLPLLHKRAYYTLVEIPAPRKD